MSKKKLVLKKLQKGKFYAVHEGSKRGHPGKLYWKSTSRTYTSSSRRGHAIHRHIILIVPTEKGVKKSYVYKRPLLAKRKDVGSELIGMAFSKADKKKIKEISSKDFNETMSISRRDRRYVRRLRKKPKI